MGLAQKADAPSSQETVAASPTSVGIFFMVFGLLLIFVSLYFESPASPNHLVERLSNLLQTGLKTLDVLGVAIFAIGAMNVLIETKSWSNYYRERLREIVLEQSYLRTLGVDQLSRLNTEVLKARFKNPSIDSEGSFLNYLNSNIYHFMAEPYREDVSAEILYTEADADHWQVLDKVTYICRKGTTGIQPNINWQVDDDEYDPPFSVAIEIRYPSDHPSQGKIIKCKVELVDNKITESLADYKDDDRLIVVILENYKIKKTKLNYWTMAEPTKNFDIIISYPSNYRMQMKTLVLNPELILTTEQDGYYKAKYDFWMLPGTGMAWTVIPQEKSQQSAPAQ